MASETVIRHKKIKEEEMFENKNLRTHLTMLATDLPRQLIEVDRTIDPNLEVSALLVNLEKQSRYPTLVFKNAKNLHGEGSSFPLITNLFASREGVALAFGLKPEESKLPLTEEVGRRGSLHVKPQVTAPGDSPIREVVLEGEDVDLQSLPVPVHHSLDSGPYILAGVLVIKDPDSGNFNVSMARVEVKGKTKAGILFSPPHHNSLIYKKYEKLNKPMPAALILGHHPTFFMGCQFEGPGSLEGVNEYDLVGGFMNEPVRITESYCFGQELMVPSDAEIILEGKIPPGVREEEGPMCEHTRFYTNILGDQKIPNPSPILQIKAITHRKDAYFLDTFAGHADESMLSAIPKEGMMLAQVRKYAPGVTALHLPNSGAGRYSAYISLKRRASGEARNALMASFVISKLQKYAIAVDDDVDVYNEQDVLWAVVLRTQPDQDVIIISDMMASPLDPGHVMKGGAVSSKMAIDATRPYDRPFYAVGQIPEELLKKIKIEDFLPS